MEKPVIRYIYITENSKNLANSLYSELSKDYKSEILSYGEFKKRDSYIFDNSDFLVFIMATGIVVRAIARLIKSKFTDPGVVVMDEKGKNVISLLSGHIGGANELTEIIAKKISANPVITTATDVNNKGSIDMIVKKLGAKLDNIRECSLEINSMIIRGQAVNIFIQEEYRHMLDDILSGFSVYDSLEQFLGHYEEVENNKEKFVIITDRKDYINKISEIERNNLQNLFIKVYPQYLVLGVGCRKNTDSKLFEKELIEYLNTANLMIESISTIGSIDIKEKERCILDFAEKYHIKTRFFTKEELSQVEHKYEKSDFVKNIAGVYSVAEPSCDLLSGANIIFSKHKSNKITISIGRKI